MSLPTLLLLFKCAKHRNKRTFVSTANEALVGTQMTIGDPNDIFPIKEVRDIDVYLLIHQVRLLTTVVFSIASNQVTFKMKFHSNATCSHSSANYQVHIKQILLTLTFRSTVTLKAQHFRFPFPVSNARKWNNC